VEGQGAQVPPHQRQVAALGGGGRSGPASCPAPAPRVRLRRNEGAEVAPRVAQGYRRSGNKVSNVSRQKSRNGFIVILKGTIACIRAFLGQLLITKDLSVSDPDPNVYELIWPFWIRIRTLRTSGTWISDPRSQSHISKGSETIFGQKYLTFLFVNFFLYLFKYKIIYVLEHLWLLKKVRQQIFPILFSFLMLLDPGSEMEKN
jgi:hypothetical protein